MATGTIIFTVGAATLPDGTTDNAAPGIQRVKSTGTPPTGGPNLFLREAVFDAATDEMLMWDFRMPGNYASGGTLKIQVKPKTTQTGTNVFVCKAAIAAVTPGAAENLDSKSFPTPDTVSITLANNQAAGVVTEGSLALSATALNSVAAGDACSLMLGRDANNASDTAAGDMALLSVTMEYTTT